LFSILYLQNIVFTGLRGERKPLLFNTLHGSPQNIPDKGVTGKILRNKELTGVSIAQRVLKDQVPPPEQRTGGAGDWLPRSHFTIPS
jgi:hypothetical protein